MLFGFMFDYKTVYLKFPDALCDFPLIFDLQVNPFSSVSAAHGIGENVCHQIHKSHHEVTEIFIHIGILHGDFIPKLVVTN